MTTNRLAKSETLPKRSAEEICDDANLRMLNDPNGRRDVHWYADAGQARIGWLHQLGCVAPETGHVMERDRSQFRPDDWRELNAYLEGMGSPVRYHSGGERYEIGDDHG